jgi:hypothetical protein
MGNSRGGSNFATLAFSLFGAYMLFRAWNTYFYGSFSYHGKAWTVSDPLNTAIVTALFGVGFIYIAFLIFTSD